MHIYWKTWYFKMCILFQIDVLIFSHSKSKKDDFHSDLDQMIQHLNKNATDQRTQNNTEEEKVNKKTRAQNGECMNRSTQIYSLDFFNVKAIQWKMRILFSK